MISRKNIFIAAALVLTGAAPLFAKPVTYGEAAAPWSAEQAVNLPPVITPDFLKEVEKDLSPAAAAGLAEKKEKVSALVKRFKSCALNAGDLNTAEKYFTPELKAEVRYFAGVGCAERGEPAEGGRAAAAQSVSLDNLEGLSASGILATSEGSAGFFDGVKYKGAAEVPVQAGWPVYQAAGPAVIAATYSKPLFSNIPALRAERPERGSAKMERPADLYGKQVIFPVDVKIGQSWGTMNEG